MELVPHEYKVKVRNPALNSQKRRKKKSWVVNTHEFRRRQWCDTFMNLHPELDEGHKTPRITL
jgi:hypothetical protein